MTATATTATLATLATPRKERLPQGARRRLATSRGIIIEECKVRVEQLLGSDE